MRLPVSQALCSIRPASIDAIGRPRARRHRALDAVLDEIDLRPGGIVGEPLRVRLGVRGELGLARLVRAVQDRAAAGSACRTAPRSARRAAGRRRRSSGCSCRGGTSPRGRRCSRPATGPCRATRCRRDRRPSRRSSTSSSQSLRSGGMLYQRIGCCQTTSLAAFSAACSTAMSIR